MKMEKVGTVELLRLRIYPIDPENHDDVSRTDVIVQPGIFDLYSDGLSYVWLMTGKINVGRMHRMGDGLFSMSVFDKEGDLEVTFPSRTFGIDEWAEFRAEDTCTEGHPLQRIRVTIDPEWSHNLRSTQ